jgi:hypothetical protein
MCYSPCFYIKLFIENRFIARTRLVTYLAVVFGSLDVLLKRATVLTERLAISFHFHKSSKHRKSGMADIQMIPSLTTVLVAFWTLSTILKDFSLK